MTGGTAVQTGQATWQLDPAHSSVEFSVKHMMMTTVRGRFKSIKATLRGDRDHPEDAGVEATIDAASVDTGVGDRDAHLRGPDFFDAEKFPTATFTSTSVTAAGEGQLKVAGDLTVHGVTRPVVLDVTINKLGEHPFAKVPAAGFDARTTIKRSEFGVGGYVPAVSDEVTIEITVESKQAK